MKGFKGFNKDLKCRGFQYEVGKDFEHDGPVETCERGFHFCENPMDVFNYYSPADSRFCEVEGDGEIDKGSDGDSKVAVSKLHVSMEIGLKGIIEAGVKFILEKVNWKDAKESNTGNNSAATNTGDNSAATNTGNNSAATNTGYGSAATNTGNNSAATNTGDNSAATNTGDNSAATNTGDNSAATNTGDNSAATNTGYGSAATNTGNRSAANVEGAESVACGLGIENKAKGVLGCWLVLAEWIYSYEDSKWNRKDVQCAKIDGEIIKADTWYTLQDGKFTEVEDD
ncbi:MAG: DUF7666 domain-containing protein [Ruminiclostridium sp.]